MQKHLVLLLLFTAVSSLAAMTFVHPGALNSREQLNFVKRQISIGAEPWRSEFECLQSSNYATREPHPLTEINSNKEDAEVSRHDAAAAYAQALLWYFTGEEKYAHSSVRILNAWSKLEGFTAGTDQDRLQAGWIGAVLAPAAEIMRTFPGWTAAAQSDLQAMFKRAFYPQLTTASRWNGNIDLTQIDAALAIAVFNEDEALFREGLRRWRKRLPAYFYLTSDGPLPASIEGDNGDQIKFWHNPLKWVDGLSQESCRDFGHHTQFALASALHAAETAWLQGVDLYGEEEARLTAAMELLARQFLEGSMLGVSANDVPSRERFNTWEVGFRHYHARRGIPMPMTERLIREQIRRDSLRAIWNINYETLTHGVAQPEPVSQHP
ncbi:alginate lyase family protein [Nibricoccus sp. IMCC34717]|uniref:alginate lyase family protein n=1 Tax=Nibricoccus sp. IMCC34717 TaxID=3034021 RepID=UPI00384ADB78